jgi:hypothetical protein
MCLIRANSQRLVICSTPRAAFEAQVGKVQWMISTRKAWNHFKSTSVGEGNSTPDLFFELTYAWPNIVFPTSHGQVADDDPLSAQVFSTLLKRGAQLAEALNTGN